MSNQLIGQSPRGDWFNGPIMSFPTFYQQTGRDSQSEDEKKKEEQEEEDRR